MSPGISPRNGHCPPRPRAQGQTMLWRVCLWAMMCVITQAAALVTDKEGAMVSIGLSCSKCMVIVVV